MKKIFYTFVLFLFAQTSFCQFYWKTDFDTPDTAKINYGFHIDTLKSSTSKWQIGHPQKKVFDSAYSNPNALVTDTLNSLPPNDTSGIIYHWYSPDRFIWGELVLQFKYRMEGNAEDRGMVEISVDKGKNWSDLSSLGMYYWEYGFKPTLKGSSGGWKHYGVHLGPFVGNHFSNKIDSFLFRFTYFTSNDTNKKDGWMIDNLNFFYHIGIEEVQNDNYISLYPNPANQHLQIVKTNNTSKQIVQIFDCTGQVLYNNSDFTGETINTSQLSNGIYILKYSDTKYYSMKKFIVQHQ